MIDLNEINPGNNPAQKNTGNDLGSRKQFVYIIIELSFMNPISIEVPQGSAIGLLLVTFYFLI